jgi:hypothetical protein
MWLYPSTYFSTFVSDPLKAGRFVVEGAHYRRPVETVNEM